MREGDLPAQHGLGGRAHLLAPPVGKTGKIEASHGHLWLLNARVHRGRREKTLAVAPNAKGKEILTDRLFFSSFEMKYE